MRGRKQNLLAPGIKISARGPSLARTHFAQIRAVDLDREYLIAGIPVARRLKDQMAAIGREIRFGVLAAMGQLLDVAKMTLAIGAARRWRRRLRRRDENG